MRVAMVCPYSLSRPGGVQGQSIGLAAALRRLGVSVTVVAPDDRRALGDHGDTAVVGRSVGIAANGSVAPVALSPVAAWRTERLIEQRRFDVAHLHEPLAPLLGYGILWRATVPAIGTFHRSGDSTWYRALSPAARWANQRLAARCAVSEAAARTARRAMGGDYEVLYNGVDVERFAKAEPSPTEGPTVLFLGRHEARKGLEVLLEAFSALAVGRLPPPVLWVAGDGPATEGLRRRFPPSATVAWLGVLGEDEVASRLAAAHVVCAPSLSGESFGMVLLEAMAARCVVVASDIDGYRQAAGGHALLVAPGDPRALAAVLDDALLDASRASGPGADQALTAAFDHAQGWSMDRLARRYLAIYEQALGTAQPPDGGTLVVP